jgi:protein gp37
MGVATKIQWTHHTFNPWRGCTKVSPGCANCYAEKLGARNRAVLGEWGPAGRRAIAAESYWRQPTAWDRAAAADGVRRRVFCASLADVFEDNGQVVDARARLFDAIDRTPNLIWLLLTKRPENVGACWPAGKRRPNVWLGASVEDRERERVRVPELLRCRGLAPVLFLSVEPLLGPIEFPALDGIDWLIVGGESGPGARPCDVAWIRSIIGQASRAGVAPFVKQLGANVVEDGRPLSPALADRKGGDPDEWPDGLSMREFPD